jgi:hypothetical protein
MPQFRRAVYAPFLKASFPVGLYDNSQVDRNLSEIDYDGMVKLGDIIDGILSLFGRTDRIILEQVYGLKDGRKETKAGIGRLLGLTADQVSDRQIKAMRRTRRRELYRYLLYNSLFSRYPEMLGEWKDKGDRRRSWGDSITVKSNRKMNWRCSTNPKHEWQATPRQRTRKKTPMNCPDCEKKGTKQS